MGPNGTSTVPGSCDTSSKTLSYKSCMSSYINSDSGCIANYGKACYMNSLSASNSMCKVSSLTAGQSSACSTCHANCGSGYNQCVSHYGTPASCTDCDMACSQACNYYSSCVVSVPVPIMASTCTEYNYYTSRTYSFSSQWITGYTATYAASNLTSNKINSYYRTYTADNIIYSRDYTISYTPSVLNPTLSKFTG